MRKIILLVSAALVLTGCSQKSERAAQLPSSRGLPYEVALIIPQSLYQGALKDTLEAVLKASTPVLNQHEPLFRVDVVYGEANLTAWRTMRNRLLVSVEADAERPAMGVARDVMARPQIEVKVTARNAQELAAFLGAQRERLTDLFVDSELEFEAARLRRKYSRMTADSLQRFGHRICVPEGLHASKVGQDFLWTGTNLNDADQNFVFYSYAWDGRPLTAEQYVAKRDSALRVNIPGPQMGQWMQTATVAKSDDSLTRVPLIIARQRVIGGASVQEVHGLWEMRDAALGGAFVALERVDTAARRVLVTEGFIYSPHSPKRNLLRQMEAALRTFK